MRSYFETMDIHGHKVHPPNSNLSSSRVHCCYHLAKQHAHVSCLLTNTQLKCKQCGVDALNSLPKPAVARSGHLVGKRCSFKTMHDVIKIAFENIEVQDVLEGKH